MNNIVPKFSARQNYQQTSFKGDNSKKIIKQIKQQSNKPMQNNGISSKFINFAMKHFSTPKDILNIGSLNTPDCSSARSLKSRLLSMKANISIMKFLRK